jgi:hypothetical protein
MLHFNNIDYLAKGNHSQQSAFNVLKNFRVMESLTEFTPILVGTVPLQINIAGSDLDIVCSYSDQQHFISTVDKCFSTYVGFTLKNMLIKEEETVLVNFMLGAWPVEVFAQKVPVHQQAGYRHMIVEYNLLLQHGTTLKEEVLKLKEQGLKTEPAFAAALNIKGDPYNGLLNVC